MVKFEEVEKVIKDIVIIEIKCDRCGGIIFAEKDKEKYIIEDQEGYLIDFVGGYGSVFGDGMHVKCDLCQSCLKELIGQFCQISWDNEDENETCLCDECFDGCGRSVCTKGE